MDFIEHIQPCASCRGCQSISAVEAKRNRHKKMSGDSLDSLVLERNTASVSNFRNMFANYRTSYNGSMFRTLSVIFQTSYVVLGMFVLLASTPALAFNIDVERAMVIKGENGSMFGYSVAQHVDQSLHWLLVGAPREQTAQSGVTRGGAVFRCKTDSATQCQAIPFDEGGNGVKYVQRLGKYVQIEEKSDQWFGSTIRSSGDTGVIVACAPRYHYFSDMQDKREPVGVCYLAKSSTTSYEKYSPCSTEVDRSDVVDQYHRQGYCQAGFSASFSKDGKKLLVGAPGSWYWQGQLFNFKTDKGGEIISSTIEGGAEEDATYMGYSSATGEFDGDSSDDYVVGIPKADHYLGRIELFTQSLTVMGSIIGEQMGAYFGYSLAVTDLNGDRMDDIIVGAPFYADLESSDAYDSGRVYIFYQTSTVGDSGKVERNFSAQTRDVLDGHKSRSRFGQAISGLGDINYDGFNDLCVGAPYAGDDKRGAIYIFHGSKKGIITEVSQIIYAKEVGTSLSAFGAAVSGGLDQDANYYPDLLVGAYESDTAVFLRTKPVVRVYASLRLQPEMISLDSESCLLEDNTRAPCLTVYTCLKYDGVGTPNVLDFNATWTLDSKDRNSSFQEQRAFYTNSGNKFTETRAFTLQKDLEFCTSSYAYVKKDPFDKLSPIKATMEFKLMEPKQQSLTMPPILDAYIPTTTSFTAHIQKDCGEDNICVPNLAVSGQKESGQHRLGSTEPIRILVIVYNNGEDSFNTNLWIDLPAGVTYNTISDQQSNVAISCDTLKPDTTKVVCALGNPMRKNSESLFILLFTPTNANTTKDVLEFTLSANSTNPEHAYNYNDNLFTVEIPVVFDEPNIVLYGKSNPELAVLNTTEERGEERGRSVSHLFQLVNNGPSSTKQTELQIKWPSHDSQGNPVLVIDRALQIKGTGTCKIIIITPNNSTGYTGLGNTNTMVELGDERDRRKRDTSKQSITCSNRYCTVIQCLVGFMAPSDNFVLTVESQLMVRSFIQRREATEMYHITSIAFARVRSVPYDLQSVDPSKFGFKRIEVVTNVNTDRHKPASKGVEIWIIAVAVTAGLLFLLLLILLLWWCGFFKRKKPEEGYFVVNGKADTDNAVSD